MTETLLSEPQGPTTPLQPIGPADLEAWLADRPPMVRALAEAAKFTGKPGQVLALPGTHLHLYGKRDAKRGRKMGHLNVTAATPEQARATALQACAVLGLPAF